MQSIIFAIIAYLSAGIGDVFSVFLSRKQNAASVMTVGFISRMSIYLLMASFFISELSRITFHSFIFNVIVGLASASGYYCFYKAFQYTNPVIVASVSGSWGGTALLFSLVFLGQYLSVFQTLCVAVIFLGFACVTVSFNTFHNIKFTSNKGIWYSIAAAILWGICGSFLKIPIEEHGWFWSTFILVACFSIFLGYVYLAKKEKFVKPTRSIMYIYLICAALITCFELSYNIGLNYGNAAVVASIGGTYSTLTVAISAVIFKEKLTRMQLAGSILTLIGIVVLSVVTLG